MNILLHCGTRRRPLRYSERGSIDEGVNPAGEGRRLRSSNPLTKRRNCDRNAGLAKPVFRRLSDASGDRSDEKRTSTKSYRVSTYWIVRAKPAESPLIH